MKRFRSGTFLVLAAAMLWGTTGTTQALAPSGASPVTIGALRLVVGGLAMLVLAAAKGGVGIGRGWPAGTTVLAAALMASYQLTFFAAVKLAGVAAGTIVGIGSSPVIAGILGFVVLGERPGKRWAVATVMAVTGCSMLAGAGGGSGGVSVLGIALALGAGASYAGYTLLIKNLLAGRDPDVVMAAVFCLGALFLLPVLLTADLRWLLDGRGIATMLYLGIVPTAASYWLFTRGLREVSTATAVTLSLAEPLTATLLGVIALGERLSPVASLGVLFLFAGLAFLTLGARRVTSAD